MIIYPDTTELKKQYNLQYKEMFLKENDLKVGDEITCEFDYDVLRPRYRKPGSDKFNFRKEGKGILKEDENGFLYAESIDLFSFYYHADNGIFGRGRREWYIEEKKKAIRKFYNSFL